MEIVGKHVVHRGTKFNFAMNQIRTRGGEIIERGFIDHPGSVVMIPVHDNGDLVFVRQYRHAVNRVMLELPAGTAQWEEPLEVTAIRELAEETGLHAGRWTRLHDIFPLPGATNECMGYFQAEKLTQGNLALEIDEELTPERHSLSEALEMIRGGAICDAKTIVGIWMHLGLVST